MKSYAVLPAAGQSARMGRPKLLLPYQEARIIDRVLHEWSASVDRVAVVIRPGDEELAAAISDYDVDIVRPEFDPPDMLASIQAGLKHLDQRYAPEADDCWLLAPADMPSLERFVIQRLLKQYRENPAILVAAFNGKRGHPLLVPWSRADEVRHLPHGASMRDLMAQWEVELVACDSRSVLLDVDTPQQYRSLLEDEGGE